MRSFSLAAVTTSWVCRTAACRASAALTWAVTSVAYLTTLNGLPFGSEDRVVTGLDPDFPAALADPLVLAGIVFAAPELFPEQPVVRALAEARLDEHRVVLAGDFAVGIAEHVEEVLVGAQNLAVEREFDHRLGLVDGLELAAEIGVSITCSVMSVAYFTTLNGLPL